MTTYLDDVPEDILKVIFFMIPLPNDLENLIDSPFRSIMTKSRIWKEKLNFTFPDVTWPLVPASLVTYEDNEVIKSLYMYDRFYWSYDAAKESYYKFGNGVIVFSFRLSSINNFDVLTLRYTNRVSKDIELYIYKICKYVDGGMRRTDPTDRDILNVVYDIPDKYVFDIITDLGEGTYIVSRKDVFNVLLHVYCNGR